MKKRALSLLLASFAAIACLICGCGGESSGSIIILDGETDKARQTEITVYGHRTDSRSLGVFENALQSFMAENSNLTAAYESAPEARYWQALDRRFLTGNLDDLFMTEHDRLITMSESGALADLSDTVSENTFNDFARSQLKSPDGKIYAVPTAISTYGLYVNYDLLASHGMKNVPANYEDFTSVCNYFTENGVTPVICNNYSSLRSLILAKGMYETYCTADTESEIAKFNADPSLLSAALNGGIDLVYEMIENDWIDAGTAALTENLSDDLELFVSGEYPFMITGGWASATIKEMLDRSGKSLSYGIYALPVLDASGVLVAKADSLLSVAKGEKENDAKKLLNKLTAPGNVLLLNENQSRFSPLNGQTQIYADSAIIPSASYLTKGRYVIASDINLDIPLDSYLTECSTMILSGESAETVKARLIELLDGAVEK